MFHVMKKLANCGELLSKSWQASRPWQGDELLYGDALPPDYGWRRVEAEGNMWGLKEK